MPMLIFLPSLFFLKKIFKKKKTHTHIQEQIFPLECSGRYPELLKLLRHCCEDEVHHKEDAAARWLSGGGGGREGGRPWYAQVWAKVVRWGSKGAVAVCKRI